MAPRSMRIGIAGAGLAGRLCAFYLLRAGHSVSVFDRCPSADPPLGMRRAAAWTAAGMLSPIAEMESGGPMVRDLGRRSLALWTEINAIAPVGLTLEDSIMVCHAQDLGAAQRVIRLLDDGPERTIAPMAGPELLHKAPAMKGTLHAWRLTGEGHLHPALAMRSLLKSCDQAIWNFGLAVSDIRPGEIWQEGQQHQFDWVIDARGTGARPALSVRGVRGETLLLHAPGLKLSCAVRLLHPRWRVYIVPRPDEQLVIGATEIESEDLSPISVQSTMELLSAAFSIFPSLAEARILATDVNLRPAMPDNLPYTQNCDGLTRINGLFRHGWLLAPAVIEQAFTQAQLH